MRVTFVFEIDAVAADNASSTNRVAPTTGVMDAGANSFFTVGSNTTSVGTVLWNGEIGFCGMSDTYLTNPNDFMISSGPRQLDEVTWSQWGTQPEFWNEFATMIDNKGDAGNMTANGTITGPA